MANSVQLLFSLISDMWDKDEEIFVMFNPCLMPTMKANLFNYIHELKNEPEEFLQLSSNESRDI
ncbi:hypothetical protein BLOT_016062 [Blomia tropicalis]|nr:hypothetical protein BLOT_016062 [Blomia tropicalis]